VWVSESPLCLRTVGPRVPRAWGLYGSQSPCAWGLCGSHVIGVPVGLKESPVLGGGCVGPRDGLDGIDKRKTSSHCG
jgi:hypothetical protein